MKQTTLITKLTDFLNEPKHLQEIYKEFPDEKQTTIRGRLNENINKCFKRVFKGVYLSSNGNTQALVIEGNAWDKIKEFEDNSKRKTTKCCNNMR